ncbi:MAG: hypothetical protein WC868_13310 [Bacteroidales bacterium]
MATFIFRKNSGLMPIFVSFDPEYKNFSVSEGISENEDLPTGKAGGKSWKVDILLKIDNPKEAYNQLKQGIKVMTKSGIHYLVKIKRVFIIEKIQVFHDNEEIKGKQYIEFR